MTSDPDSSDELLRYAGVGDPNALAELFARHRDRLRRMVRLRLDRRLRGRGARHSDREPGREDPN